MYQREMSKYELRYPGGRWCADAYLPAWATPNEVHAAVRSIISSSIVAVNVRRVGDIARWSNWSLVSPSGGVFYEIVRVP